MKNSFYITTAIDYSNGKPHMGHAYEKIGADVIARYQRSLQKEVFFMVGTDEHSQNVVKKASENSISPKEWCDRMAQVFHDTYRFLQVSFDRFIRTSDADHHKMVQWISQKVYDHGDISKSFYEGPYCVSCEAFYQEKDLVDGACPTHKIKATLIKEENYFFKLSKYQTKLIDHITKHPEFIEPESRRNEILSFLQDPLQDISISRAGTTWGVTLPFDSKAVAYVWFDALTNYLTGSGAVGSDSHKKFWPASLHVVGKDITRFHCVIWPAMLMSAGVPLPEKVWGHGFVNLSGQKMSKTTGTMIDPHEIAQRYGVHALRYFLMREVPWVRDGDFSEERLVEIHNAELSNGIGNLLSRTVSMIHKYQSGTTLGKSADITSDPQLEATWSHLSQWETEYHTQMKAYLLHEGLVVINNVVRHLNLLIDQKKPWALAKDPNQKNQLQALLHTCFAGIALISRQLAPFIPEKSTQMDVFLNAGPWTQIDSLKTKQFTTKVPEPIFPRLERAPDPAV